MLVSSLSASLLLAAAAPSLASPLVPRHHAHTETDHATSHAHTGYDWAAGGTPEIPIHESCNATEVAQLRRAMEDSFTLARHAKEHILRFGNESMFFQKYFGTAATAEPVGWFERMVSGDRTGVLFRCDDPDGNCALNPSKWSSSRSRAFHCEKHGKN